MSPAVKPPERCARLGRGRRSAPSLPRKVAAQCSARPRSSPESFRDWLTEISFSGFTRLNFSRTSAAGVMIVGQAFEPAGSADIPVRCLCLATGKSPEPADKNVCATGKAVLRSVRTTSIRASAGIRPAPNAFGVQGNLLRCRLSGSCNRPSRRGGLYATMAGV